MRLTWLPEVLRAAGLTVHEYSGREHDGRTWSTRGSSDWGPIRGITIHETRGSRSSTDAGELRVLVTGSSSAPPPIAQLYLSRSGDWWVVASGRCNHNLTGWAGPNSGYGNSRLLGIEAQHAGGEPWTDRQYRSYVRGVAALVRRLDVPVSRVAGHFEHQPGAKTDPSFNMDQFRRDVAAALAGEDDDMPYTEAQLRALPWQYNGRGIADNDLTPEGNISTLGVLNFIYTTVKALAERSGIPAAELAQIRAAAQQGAQTALAESVDEIVAGVIAGLDPTELTIERVEQAMRNVLLRGAAPAGS